MIAEGRELWAGHAFPYNPVEILTWIAFRLILLLTFRSMFANLSLASSNTEQEFPANIPPAKGWRTSKVRNKSFRSGEDNKRAQDSSRRIAVNYCIVKTSGGAAQGRECGISTLLAAKWKQLNPPSILRWENESSFLGDDGDLQSSTVYDWSYAALQFQVSFSTTQLITPRKITEFLQIIWNLQVAFPAPTAENVSTEKLRPRIREFWLP